MASVLDFLHCGSSISVRSFVRLGSCFSVAGHLTNRNVGGTLSTFSFVNMGSSLSIRSFSRLGSGISVAGVCTADSTLSVKSAVITRGYLSTLNSVAFGSNLSVRSFVRLGSSVSLGHTTGGSDKGTLRFGGAKLESDGSNFTIYGGTKKAITMQNTGNNSSNRHVLHGTWVSENEITSSDRRLKTDIIPIYRKLMERFEGGKYVKYNNPTPFARTTTTECDTTTAGHPEDCVPSTSSSKKKTSDESSMELLRALRPVSFKYKHTPESKYSRYGFIAQELEKVIPDIITTSGEDGMKSVKMTDFIAVLTMVIQSVEAQTHDLETRAFRLRDQVKADYDVLEPKVSLLEDTMLKELLENVVVPRLIISTDGTSRSSTISGDSGPSDLSDVKEDHHPSSDSSFKKTQEEIILTPDERLREILESLEGDHMNDDFLKESLHGLDEKTLAEIEQQLLAEEEADDATTTGQKTSSNFLTRKLTIESDSDESEYRDSSIIKEGRDSSDDPPSSPATSSSEIHQIQEAKKEATKNLLKNKTQKPLPPADGPDGPDSPPGGSQQQRLLFSVLRSADVDTTRDRSSLLKDSESIYDIDDNTDEREKPI